MNDTLRRVRAILAASAGNLVEWYDFYVYSFCTLYFAPLFFPHGDRTTQLLQAASVFAIGFLARPFGGWFFGRYADRKGRRAAMVLSVSMMCGGSLMIALLPVYTEAGIVAPALLLLARLVQGFSVGGEYGTSAAYMSEVAVAARRGFFGSFQYVTLIGGQLLAVLVLVLLQQWLSDAQLHAWGWRLPFLLGAAFAVVVLYLRRRMPETAGAAVHDPRAGSVRELLRHRRALLVVTGLTAGGSLAFYIYTTYMQKYLVNSAGMDPRTASLLMSVALFVYMLMQPVFGALSDRIGRRNSLIGFAALSVLGTIPLLGALRTVSDPFVAFGLIMVAYCIISLYTSISGLLKAELFPLHVRALGVGLPYAIANAAFGGTAEAVALWFKASGIESQFAVYATLMAAVALVAALYMPDTRRNDLVGDVELPPP